MMHSVLEVESTIATAVVAQTTARQDAPTSVPGDASPMSQDAAATALDAVSDVALVNAARSGDRAAFARLYERYARVVHAIALAHVDLSEADDLVQDVFLRAWRRLPDLRDTAAWPAWLCSIARAKAMDARRAGARRRGILRRFFARESPSLAQCGLDERTMTAAPEAREALAAIHTLPESYRETLLLRLVAGLSGPQIAMRTGLTEGSVRINLHRGMKLLRSRLERGARS